MQVRQEGARDRIAGFRPSVCWSPQVEYEAVPCGCRIACKSCAMKMAFGKPRLFQSSRVSRRVGPAASVGCAASGSAACRGSGDDRATRGSCHLKKREVHARALEGVAVQVRAGAGARTSLRARACARAGNQPRTPARIGSQQRRQRCVGATAGRATDGAASEADARPFP